MKATYITASYCSPCKLFSPIVARVLDARGIPLTKLDSEEDMKAVGNYCISSVPTLILLDHGVEIGRLEGAYPETVFSRRLDELLAL